MKNSSHDRKAVITVRDLTAGYGETVILRDLNFEIYEGEIFVILGGSGCGKSTLLKHLIGLLPPLAGTTTPATAPPCSKSCATAASSFRAAPSSAP